MSKDPAFLFYPSAFLTGVSDLTMEERGQYITLLCLQHQKGGIITEKTIRLSLGSVSVDVLSKFSKDGSGNYFNERLKKEIENRAKFIESRVKNGKLGGRPKENEKPLAKPLAKANENLTKDTNKDINENKDGIEYAEVLETYPFEMFWDLYDKKVGRPKSELKWKKLSEKEKQEICDFIPRYIEAQPDKQFRQNPETFFNNRTWEDELIIKTNTNGKQGTNSKGNARDAFEVLQELRRQESDGI